MKICIDAGHGGKDPGAIGSKRTEEKKHVLDMCKMAGEYAENQGFKVVYTRTEDIFVSLSRRAQIANENNCDVFVSIHNNSFKDPKANGMETWSYPGSNEGLKLSKIVEKEVVIASGLRDRGCKTARFAVLRRSNMPAILVEVGFISNPYEERLLMKADFKSKIAEAIVKGICNYFGLVYKPFNSEIDPVSPIDLSANNNSVENKKNLVLKTQKFLNSIGMRDYEEKKLVEDGIMGKRTESALKKLEKNIL